MHRPAAVLPLSFTVDEDSQAQTMLYNSSEFMLTVPDRPRNPSPALILDDEDEEDEDEDEQVAEKNALYSSPRTFLVVKPVPVRLPPWQEEKWDDDDNENESHLDCGTAYASGIPSIVVPTSAQALQAARDGLLLALSATGGNTDGHPFRQCLTTLHQYYRQTRMDVRTTTNASAGTWLTLTKPIFADCLGQNDQGDPLYTLSRMSFDMFRPSQLVCSLQGNFNCVEPVPTGVPPVLQADVHPDDASFCTYNTVCAFTMERALPAFPNAPNAHLQQQQCRGILSTQGYIVADPDTPNRHTVWITEGNMHANDAPQDLQVWKDFFNAQLSTVPPSRAQSLLARQLRRSGVDHQVDPQSFQQSYRFRRALGGHGLAYVDTLYVDQSLRIIRGHRGTLFVFSRMGP